MNHAQLKAFHAVAEHRRITAAANSLGITQPAVTLQIKALEKKYQIPLFQRKGHSITLTNAGALLHDLSSQYFSLENEAHSLLLSLRQQKSECLKISSNIPHRIFPLTEAFRLENPNVDLSVTIASLETIKVDLEKYNSDLAITQFPILGKDFECLEIGREPITITLPKSHPLASRTILSFQELIHLKALVYSDTGGLDDLEKEILDFANKPKENTQLFDNRYLIQEAVAYAQGFAFLSKCEIEHDNRLVSIDISGCPIKRREYLIFKKQRIILPIIKEFRQHLIQNSHT